jgi:hypothetical protein
VPSLPVTGLRRGEAIQISGSGRDNRMDCHRVRCDSGEVGGLLLEGCPVGFKDQGDLECQDAKGKDKHLPSSRRRRLLVGGNSD